MVIDGSWWFCNVLPIDYTFLLGSCWWINHNRKENTHTKTKAATVLVDPHKSDSSRGWGYGTSRWGNRAERNWWKNWLLVTGGLSHMNRTGLPHHHSWWPWAKPFRSDSLKKPWWRALRGVWKLWETLHRVYSNGVVLAHTRQPSNFWAQDNLSATTDWSTVQSVVHRTEP